MPRGRPRSQCNARFQPLCLLLKAPKRPHPNRSVPTATVTAGGPLLPQRPEPTAAGPAKPVLSSSLLPNFSVIPNSQQNPKPQDFCCVPSRNPAVADGTCCFIYCCYRLLGRGLQLLPWQVRDALRWRSTMVRHPRVRLRPFPDMSKEPISVRVVGLLGLS